MRSCTALWLLCFAQLASASTLSLQPILHATTAYEDGFSEDYQVRYDPPQSPFANSLVSNSGATRAELDYRYEFGDAAGSFDLRVEQQIGTSDMDASSRASGGFVFHPTAPTLLTVAGVLDVTLSSEVQEGWIDLVVYDDFAAEHAVLSAHSSKVGPGNADLTIARTVLLEAGRDYSVDYEFVLRRYQHVGADEVGSASGNIVISLNLVPEPASGLFVLAAALISCGCFTRHRRPLSF